MSEDDAVIVHLAPAFFRRTYDEAFRLVLETRHYLAEAGNNDARGLDVPAALAYSVESMRLTARLTHIMAWLLAVRAHHEGELDAEALADPRWRLAGHEVCLDAAAGEGDDMPRPLAELLQRSETLYRRIDRLDRMMAGAAATG